MRPDIELDVRTRFVNTIFTSGDAARSEWATSPQIIQNLHPVPRARLHRTFAQGTRHPTANAGRTMSASNDFSAAAPTTVAIEFTENQRGRLEIHASSAAANRSNSSILDAFAGSWVRFPAFCFAESFRCHIRWFDDVAVDFAGNADPFGGSKMMRSKVLTLLSIWHRFLLFFLAIIFLFFLTYL